MSSKGQVVIPMSMRRKLKLVMNSSFAVLNPKSDLIVLKKVKAPFMGSGDLKVLDLVEKAWKEIESGKFKESSKGEFLKELES